MNTHDTRWAWLVAVVLLSGTIAGLSACDDDGTTPTGGNGNGVERFFPDDYLTAFGQALDCRTFSSGHFGNTVGVYISADQLDNYIDETYGFPVGTVIVKTEYSNIDPTCGGDVIRITSMRKGPAGTAPNSGDWEWQEFDLDDGTERSGQLPECINCHSGGNPDCGPEKDFTCLILDK